MSGSLPPARPRRSNWTVLGAVIVALVLGTALVVGYRFTDAANADPAAARLAQYMHKLAPGERPPQFVLFSFDGGGGLPDWQRFLAAAQAGEAHMTVFLTGLYLLDETQKDQYTGPGHKRGSSQVGWGSDATDPPGEKEVEGRIQLLNQAFGRGHEIGTHYNGHFCDTAPPGGKSWTTAQWNDEMDQFFRFFVAAKDRGLTLPPSVVKGGRFPCLEVTWDRALPAMIGHGQAYDSSRVSDGIRWPTDEGGIMEFWMPTVAVPALGGRKVILMDYNIMVAMEGTKDQVARAAEFKSVTLDAYRAAYTAAFEQNRAPLVIGNHFNSWGGDGFNDAVDEFMREVCRKPETACATYGEVMAWMEMQDPAVLQQLRGGPGAQVGADLRTVDGPAAPVANSLLDPSAIQHETDLAG